MIRIAKVSAFADGEEIAVPGRPRGYTRPVTRPAARRSCSRAAGPCSPAMSWATRNPLTARHGPQIMPSGLNLDTPQALASLDALRGIDADVLLPGHGDPWTQGVTEAVRQAKAAGPS